MDQQTTVNAAPSEQANREGEDQARNTFADALDSELRASFLAATERVRLDEANDAEPIQLRLPLRPRHLVRPKCVDKYIVYQKNHPVC